MELIQIGHIENDYTNKFGTPRQSGIVNDTVSCIVLEGKYAVEDAVRGLSDYDYIWVIWGFSLNHDKPFSATVKPPRLGGKTRMGVFATRSPYRPNQIGLSSVKIDHIDIDENSHARIYIKGADMVNGTPVFDIKPYLAYSDAHPDARSGFADNIDLSEITLDFPQELLERIPEKKRPGATQLLIQDPRPGYEKHLEREYRLAYGGYDIVFIASKNHIKVIDVIKL